MNKFIIIKVKDNIKRFLDKSNKYNIELHDIKYINDNEILVKIFDRDLKKIKRYNYYSDITLYERMGLDYIKDKIYELKYFILVFLLCIISMYFISNIIVDIDVIHSNKSIRELVSDELELNGIKKYSYKKSFSELENIKNVILENNKDKLEWISITNDGMKYIVRIEERILDEIKEKKEYCNVVASKEGLITNIYASSGEVIVSNNDIVKKGDILISGNIVLNEESKGTMCASGKVMANVWYTTNISLNRKYLKKKYTDNERYNIEIFNKILRNKKYSKYDAYYLINTKYLKIYKELEYKFKEYKYSDKELVSNALKEVDKKFKSKIGNSGSVIKKNILEQNINSSRIDMKVFVVTNENIGEIIELEKNELINNS